MMALLCWAGRCGYRQAEVEGSAAGKGGSEAPAGILVRRSKAGRDPEAPRRADGAGDEVPERHAELHYLQVRVPLEAAPAADAAGARRQG